jgi:thiol:disulfide interchange protein DsbA
MKTIAATLLTLVALTLGMTASAATQWTEGKHYFPIRPAYTAVLKPGKVVVTEVFSYACPACNVFAPTANRLKAALPANTELAFVPASFRADEDWPMFQRAYYAAQALGIDQKTHEAMFDAVWKTNELAVFDTVSRQPKHPMPTIEDAAKWYAKKGGVPVEAFLAEAKGFTVDRKTREAEQLIRACQVVSTPTIVVNGKYRADASSAGGYEQLIELVKYLVAQESR